ncbi:DnaD domain protein [Streptococcus agalactiae]|uniref:DnaD domain-containing protein n=1 Tax=Streptococcus agalactiae TaxID=1311 RepID=UPI0002BC5B66|nr:DnaD domain protein [Streptococcus agalactiae]QBX08130.1 putative DNA replication protein [Streptococcus satellite phage Javan22]QBX08484.1 putative DNA replication protein [Streptococcus satellite phage Javan27]EPT77769.1 DNA damage-indicible protein DnaD [Streptococcus agalactiae LMG 15085]EPT81136.1 DNA damage-indicible protein DnaD [Streptococcus agalactiae LMG 15095]EPU71116.1 DNA damage-indicible protein DnaD [Streptococcus agalactiae GB00097]
MGNRRMISKTVTQTQRFLQMPLEAQALYFHLIQNADDDGIVEAFPIVRMIGANEDNLKLLQVKNFVKPLNEEMVYFIIDFFEQNQIKSNQYKKSIYQSLLSEEDKVNNLRILEEFKNGSKVEQVLNPNISQDNQIKSKIIKSKTIKDNQIKNNISEDKIASNQKNNFDTDNLKSMTNILGDNFKTNCDDETLITNFTEYYLGRVPDNYELNTLKKRLRNIDRQLFEVAYQQASINGADTLGYIVTTLDNWERLGITTYNKWSEHEGRRSEELEDELPF